jgi:arginase
MRAFTFLGVPVDSVGRSGGTEHTPTAFRALTRAGDPWAAADAGDLDVRIRGEVRDPASGVIAIDDVVGMTRAVTAAVAALTEEGRAPFVMGGCCSLLPGALAGAQRSHGDIGLVYLDGHLDLYDGRTSPTGEAADMPISVVLGRGPKEWVDVTGVTTDADRVWLVGPRDLEEALTYGHPDPSGIVGLTFIDADAIRAEGASTIGASVAEAASAGDGYWVHLDVDVLDEAAFPATDYLMDGGLEMTQLVDVLRPLLATEALAGLSIGCYNPDKDPGQLHGTALAGALRAALAASSVERLGD